MAREEKPKSYSVLIFSRDMMHRRAFMNEMRPTFMAHSVPYSPMTIGMTLKGTLVPFTHVKPLPEGLKPNDIRKMKLKEDEILVGVVETDSRFRVLYNDHPQKGFEDLAEAARKVRDRIMSGKDPVKRSKPVRRPSGPQ